MKNAISPTRTENYSEWYLEVIKAADLAENSCVRGSMVIKPWGYAIWENMQRVLDDMFKETGHENAYFPLLIPLSFLEKEAEHAEGFAKECAVVTHHRLEADIKNGGLKPAGKLEEPFVIRPTSEMIIGDAYSRWIKSYRDLPVLINQWANVMRWEMRTRMFLRTSEFLWQEGHTAHSNAEEAKEEVFKMLDIYEKFAHEYMAMPVIKGEKTPDERFAGAVDTYTIEAMMQDKKALQSGTSHFLGQNFSKSLNIKFLDQNNNEEYAWTTSWGVSTRLIGGLIMAHSDDDGLVMPPRIAQKHIVLLPIYRNEEDKNKILDFCKELEEKIKNVNYKYGKIKVITDKSDLNSGTKFWQAVKKGIPLRVEIGMQEIEKNNLTITRRDKEAKAKTNLNVEDFLSKIPTILDEIHNNLFNKALKLQKDNTQDIDNLEDFKKFFNKENSGFAFCPADPESMSDEKVQEILKKLKVTARCIPLEQNQIKSKCIFTGKEVSQKVIFGRSY